MIKEEKIDYIAKVINQFGNFSSSDLEIEQNPILTTTNKNQHDLIEHFYSNHCGVYSYVHESLVDDYEVNYCDIDEDILDNICFIVQEYEAMKIKQLSE